MNDQKNTTNMMTDLGSQVSSGEPAMRVEFSEADNGFSEWIASEAEFHDQWEFDAEWPFSNIRILRLLHNARCVTV